MHLNCNNFSINWARKSGLVPNWSPEKYLSRLCLYFDNWLIWNRFLLKKWQKKRKKKRFFLLFLSFFTPPNSGMPKACQKGLKKKLYAQKIQTKKVKIECNPYKKSMPFCLRTVGGYNTNTTLTLNLRQKNSFLYGLPSIYAEKK